MNPQKGEVPPAERKAFTKARPEPYRTMKQIAAREDARNEACFWIAYSEPDASCPISVSLKEVITEL